MRSLGSGVRWWRWMGRCGGEGMGEPVSGNLDTHLFLCCILSMDGDTDCQNPSRIASARSPLRAPLFQ